MLLRLFVCVCVITLITHNIPSIPLIQRSAHERAEDLKTGREREKLSERLLVFLLVFMTKLLQKVERLNVDKLLAASSAPPSL